MYSIIVLNQDGVTYVGEWATLSKTAVGQTDKGIWYRLEVPLKTASPLCSYNVHSLYYSHDVNSLVVAAIRTQGSIMTGIVESKLVKTMIDQSH